LVVFCDSWDKKTLFEMPLLLNGGVRSLGALRQVRRDTAFGDLPGWDRISPLDAVGNWFLRMGMSGGLYDLEQVICSGQGVEEAIFYVSVEIPRWNQAVYSGSVALHQGFYLQNRKNNINRDSEVGGDFWKYCAIINLILILSGI
jgi:hypothetical protein